jgi:hypothetical protein
MFLPNSSSLSENAFETIGANSAILIRHLNNTLKVMTASLQKPPMTFISVSSNRWEQV